MYQPYIRGKQFELIGIRELIPSILLPNITKVSPIIEPVKDSSTLRTTLRALVDNNINFTVIINPQVGSFADPDRILNVIRDVVNGYGNYQAGIIFHSRINHQDVIAVLQNNQDIISGLTLIHNTTFDNISNIVATYENYFPVRFNVVNQSLTNRRYIRNFQPITLVELDDYFNAQTKNADYLAVDESNFSEEHLFYKADGFEGFSDYLSIGEEYSESGFLPYAVAIHLSYADATNKIKIKHFVSDSNDDTSDIAGKFEEALDKLIDWCDSTHYDSVAIPIFRQYHTTGHFPGLGTLKKLSLMNHIDLVLKLI